MSLECCVWHVYIHCRLTPLHTYHRRRFVFLYNVYIPPNPPIPPSWPIGGTKEEIGFIRLINLYDHPTPLFQSSFFVEWLRQGSKSKYLFFFLFCTIHQLKHPNLNIICIFILAITLLCHYQGTKVIKRCRRRLMTFSPYL